MKRDECKVIENYMLDLMRDSAHDKHHIYRVLYAAVDIAEYEREVDTDVLVASCLLHDIGRERQFADLDLCHAEMGGEMALKFLRTINWNEEKSLHVKACISTHRYRRNKHPQSIEAKILFDADKLDASGAMGIARTLIYEGKTSEPLYILDESGDIVTGGGGEEISTFFQEYNYKLKNVYDAFYTRRAKIIASSRQKTATDFYDGLYREVSQNYERGLRLLTDYLL